MIRQKLLYSIIVIALVLGTIFLSSSTPVAFLRSGIILIFRPVFRVSYALGRTVGFSMQQPGADDLSRLQEENQRLREIEQEYTMLREKDAGLEKMVGLKERQHVPLQGGRVLLRGNELGKEFLMLDEGTAKKIRQGDLAIDARGALIGVVRETSDGFSKISLASNPGEAFEIVVAPLNVKALAKGIGNRTFSLELISNDTPVRSGDFALMPGRLGNTNMLVGEITRLTSNVVGAFQNVWATLIAHPETLDEVFIVLE
ncbi:MAG: rod shape-determining protein MreC [Candidatus Sungbacteria bacterium]|nr:rod shape-determining protein MreC [Candidatus Sungbacteria bacterium]